MLRTCQDASIVSNTTVIANSAKGNCGKKGEHDECESGSNKRVTYFYPELYWCAGVWEPDDRPVAYDSDSSSEATIRPFQRPDQQAEHPREGTMINRTKQRNGPECETARRVMRTVVRARHAASKIPATRTS